jgi:anti-sigma regulatory factor (Ser/Thr protein kinase)
MRRQGADVRVDVHDDNPAAPAMPTAAAPDGATSGRGLSIVASLADELGVEQVPDDGKIMYAKFSEPG